MQAQFTADYMQMALVHFSAPLRR